MGICGTKPNAAQGYHSRQRVGIRKKNHLQFHNHYHWWIFNVRSIPEILTVVSCLQFPIASVHTNEKIMPYILFGFN